MIKNDKTHLTEFENEVKAILSLRHPNIVQFIGICVTEDLKFIVTEFMNGSSLDAIIHSKKNLHQTDRLHKTLSYDKKLEILLDIVRGMIYMHSRQPPLLHRDLKPSNILVSHRFFP